MTIIVFLIDTSASMNQRAYLGGRPTLLDVAKGAVETFVKVRAVSSTRQPPRFCDRFVYRVLVCWTDLFYFIGSPTFPRKQRRQVYASNFRRTTREHQG